MTYEIITHEYLQEFRLQLLEDLTRLMSGTVQPQSNKEWLRSSEVRKMLGISYGTLQNLRIKNSGYFGDTVPVISVIPCHFL